MDDDDGSQPQDERWFAKAAPIIDLVNKTSKKVCKFPAFCVSIDEQMKKFKGHSGQTFRMKNKPISKGYKFWAMCCANSGYSYHFIPPAQTGNVEGRKIIDSVLLLLDKLSLKESRQYVATMDNLFTLSQVLSGASVMNVAICGTARARQGWPPKEYKNIFNECLTPCIGSMIRTTSKSNNGWTTTLSQWSQQCTHMMRLFPMSGRS